MLPCLPSPHLPEKQESRALACLVPGQTLAPRTVPATEWVLHERMSGCYLSVFIRGDVPPFFIFSFLVKSHLETLYAVI